MRYGLVQFCDDCRKAITSASGGPDLARIREYLEKLLENEAFIAEHCGPDAKFGTRTIFHDPETDFMLLAHNNEKGRTSPPHDHGSSWAVYGQAVGYTEMTEYQRKDDQTIDGQADLEKTRTYRLEGPHAGFFGPHQIHSINFPDGARFIRVTGTDLTQLETLRYDVPTKSVTKVSPNGKGDAAGSAAT